MNDILYLINSLGGLTAAILAGLIYFSRSRAKEIKDWFGIISLANIIYSAVFMLWFLGAISFSSGDAGIIIAFTTVIESVIMFIFIYRVIGHKGLYYLLFLYLASLIFLIFFSFILFFIVLSNIFVFSIFLYFISLTKSLKREGYCIFIYFILSFVWAISLILFNNAVLLHFLPRIAFLFFLYFLLLDLRGLKTEQKKVRKENNFSIFLRHLIFVITIANLLFISTVGVHEAGHIISAKYFGCERIRTIVYEESGGGIGIAPYTEVFCSDNYYQEFIILAGIFLPLIVSILLLVIGKIFVRKLAFLMLGFSLLISYRDLQEMQLSSSIIITILLSGAAILIAAIVYLAKIDRDEVI